MGTMKKGIGDTVPEKAKSKMKHLGGWAVGLIQHKK